MNALYFKTNPFGSSVCTLNSACVTHHFSLCEPSHHVRKSANETFSPSPYIKDLKASNSFKHYILWLTHLHKEPWSVDSRMSSCFQTLSIQEEASVMFPGFSSQFSRSLHWHRSISTGLLELDDLDVSLHRQVCSLCTAAVPDELTHQVLEEPEQLDESQNWLKNHFMDVWQQASKYF